MMDIEKLANTVDKQKLTNFLKKNKKLLGVVIVVLAVFVFAIMTRKTPEDLLVGEWYDQNGDRAIVLYDDGTCDILYPYMYGGTKWNIVNGNILKIQSAFGLNYTYEIVSIARDKVELDVNGRNTTFTKG